MTLRSFEFYNLRFTRINFVRLSDRKGRRDELINYLGAFTYEFELF